ncbi:hypothetical protein QTP70_015571, partial [Hemibagrus guttatus]
KKRNLCESAREELVVVSAARKQSITESVAIQETVASGSTLAAQDVKIHFQSQEKQEGDQNLDHNCSQPSSTMDDLSVLSGASQATILTSTPIVQLQKGIRLEPEGEVSKAQTSLLLTEKPETETNKEDDDVKGHLDIKAIKTESFAQQPTGIVCSKKHGVANMAEKQNERGPSMSEAIGLVVEVISGVTEEITAIGGILKRKGYTIMGKTADSCPEDIIDTLHKEGSNGVQCVNVESRVTTSPATQSRNSPHTLWNIEVPAHLVGRLIGKKGKYISSLKQSSGAKLFLSTLPNTYEFQICHIEGSEVQVEKALALIKKKFKDLDLRNRLSSSQPAAVHSLPITSWLPLPQDGTVEVIVPRVEAANYLFVQQHTHPTYYGLCSLTEQMLFCYCHSGCPSLPTPVEAGVLCAAPSPDGAWWRAQVIQHYKDSNFVQIRYVDYGGYVTVNLFSLKQIRSDFVTLPFQASEVMLENIAPLPGKETFSFEAKETLEELTQGIPLIMKVTGSQNGLPLVHMWRHTGEEISVNGWLVDHGLCSWLDSH